MIDVELSYKCISKLHAFDNYFDRWKRIRDVYASQLNTDLFNEDAQYTPHDYKNHCTNIYRILDIIIPGSAYDNSLNTEQLFCLAVAVILHDLAMLIKPENRSDHSDQAKNFILEKVLITNDSFLSHCLSHEEASFVADIVCGHSDIKDDNGEILVKTLDEIPNNNFKQGKMGLVNTRLLAGLLRLADELDVNSWRISGKSLILPRIRESSLKHWNKCNLFGFPSINDDDKTKILLRCNDDFIRMNGNFENDVKLILEVEKKINFELKNIFDSVFKNGCLSGWMITEAIAYTSDQEIAGTILKARESINPLSSTKVNLITIEEVRNIDNSTDYKTKIEIISEKFSDKIKNWVICDSLLHDGHFFIDDARYSRDWIDTNTILGNLSYLQEITDVISIYINNFKQNNNIITNDNIVVIGEGFPGVILASSVAFQNGFQLTYHVPKKYDDYHSYPEKNIDLTQHDKVIIVTDVIVTGKTIGNTIESLKKSYNISDDNILSVMCIFFRAPINDEIFIHPSLSGKIACLNNSMPIEICKKSSCLFQEFNLIEHKYKPTS